MIVTNLIHNYLRETKIGEYIWSNFQPIEITQANKRKFVLVLEEQELN